MQRKLSYAKERSKVLVDVRGFEPLTPCLQSTGVLSNNSLLSLGFQCFQ